MRAEGGCVSRREGRRERRDIGSPCAIMPTSFLTGPRWCFLVSRRVGADSEGGRSCCLSSGSRVPGQRTSDGLVGGGQGSRQRLNLLLMNAADRVEQTTYPV